MSSQYEPASGAVPVPPWSTAFLSQRDVALSIPINFVTQPAVSITEACFSQDLYLDDAASACLSNLLATGFRRVVIDVYWDSGRQLWSLCPAAIPDSASNEDDSTVSIITSTSQAALSSVQMTGRALLERQTTEASAVVLTSQASGATTTVSSSSTQSVISSTVTAASSTGGITEVTINGVTTVQLGPYNCSSTLSISTLTEVIADYLDNTSDTISGSILYLILNVHAAASSSSPTEPASAPASSALPTTNTTLSNLLSDELASYLYTPTQLREDRENLNSSWYAYDIEEGSRPDSAYFTTSTNSDGSLTTADGWPSEGFLLFGPDHSRVLASFGQIDPQMAEYNASADNSNIFREGTFEAIRNVSVSASGNVTSGCFFDPVITSLDGATNNSWAMSSDFEIPTFASTESYNTTVASISNITSCGISPLLNESVQGSADLDYRPYQTIAYSSIWSWALGEPHNISNNVDDAQLLRCAAMHVSQSGRWALTDCTQNHHAACRVPGEPYVWRIGDSSNSYTDSEGSCPDNSTFDVPRTALENSYLLSALQAHAVAHPDNFDSDPSAWINFNSLDTPGCWVVGASSSCPYSTSENEDENRLVIVPTVAAVIVFVLAALTLFIKCAANRQTSRRGRRRKGDEGWDYEGVPS